jgi:hypothetical protein
MNGECYCKNCDEWYHTGFDGMWEFVKGEKKANGEDSFLNFTLKCHVCGSNETSFTGEMKENE